MIYVNVLNIGVIDIYIYILLLLRKYKHIYTLSEWVITAANPTKQRK